MTTKTFAVNDYIEMPNKNGHPIVRIVYIGGGNVQEYRRYKNLMTNELSDWRPADNSKPVAMNDAMTAEFAERSTSA